jgi:DNA-binding transcriptional regulator GbsR (MarR family)
MATKDEKDDALLEKYENLDSGCKNIFFALQIKGPLRHDMLLDALKFLDVKMSRPNLDIHLKHLVDSGLVECKKGFQFSEYALIKDIYELVRPATVEEVKKQLDLDYKNRKKYPKRLREYRLTARQRRAFFEHFSDEQIDAMVTKEAEYLVVSSLLELRELVTYDLGRKKFGDDNAFWKLIGNPMYRMHEKHIVMNCRDCPRYKEKLFKRIEEMQMQFDEKYNKRQSEIDSDIKK